jgi:ornithine--oxo-acid transaminase
MEYLLHSKSRAYYNYPMSNLIELEQRFGAYNYHPLPVILTRGKGCYVWDTDGNRYLDMMSAYSAVSHGHAHPRLVKTLARQAGQLSVVSRAFYSDRLAPFLEKACAMSGMDKALPMNTGAEAIETAIKAVRKWAYEVKGVKQDAAQIIACEGNFHGRTLAAISMSSEPLYRKNFGPFPSGFSVIEYGNADALRKAIGPDTAAFFVEPIQGEGGIIIPPSGYLAECAQICRDSNVLLICDEIQTGLGRTGLFLASSHENVQPDGITLGKALGGGLYPVSLFAARADILSLFKPGDHGSTFGGNPLAASVALEALQILEDERLLENSTEQGRYLMERLAQIDSPLIKDIRGRGLLIGLEIHPDRATARAVCERLMTHGILTKETHDTVVRLAPPLIIEREDIDNAVVSIETTLKEMT